MPPKPSFSFFSILRRLYLFFLQHAVLLAVVASVFFVAFLHMPDDIQAHIDTFRDLLMAKNLALGSNQSSMGPPSSAHFHQGYLWTRLLALFPMLSLAWRWTMPFILVLFSVSVGLLFWILKRRAPLVVALLATACYLFVRTTHGVFTPLWNPTLIPIFSVLLAFHGWLGCRDSRADTVLWSLTGLVIGLGSQLHIVFLFFLPGVVVFLARQRLWISIAAVVFVAFGSWLLLSFDSTRANMVILKGLMGKGYDLRSASCGVPWASITFLVVAVASSVACQRISSHDDEQKRMRRYDDFITWCTLSYAVCIGAMFFIGLGSAHRYVEPLVPFFCLSASCLVDKCLKSRPGVARWALTVFFGVMFLAQLLFSVWSKTRSSRSCDKRLSIGEIGTIVEALDGWSYDPALSFAYMSAGQGLFLDFLCGCWITIPCRRAQKWYRASDALHRHVTILSIPKNHPSPVDIDSDLLRRVKGNGRDFLLIRFQPYLRRDRLARCSTQDASKTPVPRCVEVELSFQAMARPSVCMDPGLPNALRSIVRPEENGVVLRFELQKPAGGPDRVIYFPSVDAWGWRNTRCRASIIGWSGIDAELEEGSIKIKTGKTAQNGLLYVRWPTNDRSCFPDDQTFYTMPILELDARLFKELRAFLD